MQQFHYAGPALQKFSYFMRRRSSFKHGKRYSSLTREVLTEMGVRNSAIIIDLNHISVNHGRPPSK